MRSAFLMAVFTLVAPVAALSAQDTVRSFALVSRLGVDTIAVEQVTVAPMQITAEVLIRAPEARRMRHELTLDGAGNPVTLVARTLDPVSGSEIASQRWDWSGDSVTFNGERTVAAPAAAIPFIDLVHWPFDHLLRKLSAGEADRVDAPMLSGTRVSHFPLVLIGPDSATVTHPTRGTMRVRLTAEGGIAELDAGATTRALVVTREVTVDIPALARGFAEAGPVGELSGRGATVSQVQGATISLDWGTPRVRGREIWGALVPYGSVWRTGANRASHLSTDRDLQFGELVVPAGEYTLYSIIEADGGVLIINRQTEQNGQQYDAERDLGRVPLERRELDDHVEVFTIAAQESVSGGVLRLQWAGTELVAPFVVLP